MSALSEKVLTLSTNYLGPAAKVFLDRQTVESRIFQGLTSPPGISRQT